jgi:hypothetical protein
MLLRIIVNYGRKKFYNIGPRGFAAVLNQGLATLGEKLGKKEPFYSLSWRHDIQ